MKPKKQPRCHICGDTIPGAPKGKQICTDCQERAAQPRISSGLAGRFTCVECGTLFILATGECVAHRDRQRYCITCWQRSPSRYRTIAPLEKKTIAPPWAIELGVDEPYTLDKAKQRYRELSFKHHPDYGGDSAQFIIITKYYNEALASFAQETFEVTQ